MRKIEIDTTDTIARNINRLLAYYKMSRSDLAKRLHVTDSAVGYWCIGKKCPRMDKIDMMCDIFNVSRQQIVSDNLHVPATQARIVPEDEQKLSEMFMRMNAQGKAKLLERAEELIKMGYVKEGGQNDD